MTIAEAGEIFERWCVNPPVYLMVQTIARMLGWKPSVMAMPPAVPAVEIMADAPPGLAHVDAAQSGVPLPVLDPEAFRALNQERAIATARRPADG